MESSNALSYRESPRRAVSLSSSPFSITNEVSDRKLDRSEILKGFVACALEHASAESQDFKYLDKVDKFLGVALKMKGISKEEKMWLCAVRAALFTVKNGSSSDQQGARNLLKTWCADAQPITSHKFSAEMKNLLESWGVGAEVSKTKCHSFLKRFFKIVVHGVPFLMGSLLAFATATLTSRDIFNTMLEANGLSWDEYAAERYEDFRPLFELTDYMSTITCMAAVVFIEKVGHPIGRGIYNLSTALKGVVDGYLGVRARGDIPKPDRPPGKFHEAVQQMKGRIGATAYWLYKKMAPNGPRAACEWLAANAIMLLFISVALHFALFLRMNLQLNDKGIGQIIAEAFTTEAGLHHFSTILLRTACEDIVFLILLNAMVTKGLYHFRKFIKNRAYRGSFDHPILQKMMKNEELTAEERDQIPTCMKMAGEKYMEKKMNPVVQHSIEAVGVTVTGGLFYFLWGAFSPVAILEIIRQSGSIPATIGSLFSQWGTYIGNISGPLMVLGLSYGTSKATQLISSKREEKDKRLGELIKESSPPVLAPQERKNRLWRFLPSSMRPANASGPAPSYILP